jgi:hypothetical protein
LKHHLPKAARVAHAELLQALGAVAVNLGFDQIQGGLIDAVATAFLPARATSTRYKSACLVIAQVFHSGFVFDFIHVPTSELRHRGDQAGA